MKDINSIPTNAPEKLDKSQAEKQFLELGSDFLSLQELLYAQKKYALLIIFQGMDTSGKDGTIRHVFSSISPQGCRVKSFKTPTEEESSHDFLWRIYANLPEKGMIQIFNRSHYEDVLYPVVHQQVSKKEQNRRYRVIRAFEEHLKDSNTIVLKFFLHVSKEEQKERIAERLQDPKKRWKYDPADRTEEKLWNKYVKAYQLIIDKGEKSIPWIVVPADQKWYRNWLVMSTIVDTLKGLKMAYPKSAGT